MAIRISNMIGGIIRASASFMLPQKSNLLLTSESPKRVKSVNSNLTLAVHSPKLNQAKTHFLSHLGEKKRKNMARSGFEPTISRSEVDHANHYSIGN